MIYYEMKAVKVLEQTFTEDKVGSSSPWRSRRGALGQKFQKGSHCWPNVVLSETSGKTDCFF